MITYITRRILGIVPILIGVSFIAFSITALIPGDAVDIMMGLEANSEVAESLRSTFGLDKPFLSRYLSWVSNVAQGDFGFSIINGLPVLPQILEKIQPTLELAVLSTIIGILFGMPMGLIAAAKQDQFSDGFLRVAGLVGFSLPPFWIATLLILMVSLWFPGFPILEFVPFREDPIKNLEIMSLPAITLGIAMGAIIMRMTRSSVLEVMRQQYVVTARSKGLSEPIILLVHVLRNALLPVITLVGIRFGYLIGGLVIIEEIFTIPGLGRLVIYAISKRDYPLVLGTIFFIALAFMLINLLVDILYAVIDPRISYGKKE